MILVYNVLFINQCFTGFTFSFIIWHKYFATQEKKISLTVEIWRLSKLHYPILPKHATVTEGLLCLLTIMVSQLKFLFFSLQKKRVFWDASGHWDVLSL